MKKQKPHALLIERKLYLNYAVLGVMSVYDPNKRPPYATRIGYKVPGVLNDVFSVERGWHRNEPCTSCIPSGTYPLKRETQGRNMATFRKRWQHEFLLELESVPKRSQIQVHSIGSSADLLGCIGAVRQPRIGIFKKIRGGMQPHIDEIIGDEMQVIAGSGHSRDCYCDIYDAVVQYNITRVIITGDKDCEREGRR